jgi:para-aminobenzoate synthetase component 1
MAEVQTQPASVRLHGRTVGLAGRVEAGLDVPAALTRLAHRPGLVALESASGVPGRWSLVAFDPVRRFAAPGATPEERRGDPGSLAELGALIEGWDWVGDLPPGPFCGGFIGALSYELGAADEALPLPAAVWPQPPIAGGMYRDWLVFEHDAAGRVLAAHLVTADREGEEDDGEARARAVLADLDGKEAGWPERPAHGNPAHGLDVERTVPSAVHRGRVDRARALIARGEIYQANLCHRLTADVDGSALELYLALRRSNPAPYMGYLGFRFEDGADGALLSSSPELLLELEAADAGGGAGGRRARTRPIKGTIACGRDEVEDEAQRERLRGSAKDVAELAMIVDLERNDLGRISVPGGVEVGPFPRLESYRGLHHLVTDVTGAVRPGCRAVDVVAALFPGGSITGAPKLRSMEVIAEIEGEGRGFFTGSLGFIDARDRAVFNILIRTMIHRREPEGGGAVSFHVGGGVTWSSDAAAEDAETMLKAAAMIAALGGSARE